MRKVLPQDAEQTHSVDYGRDRTLRGLVVVDIERCKGCGYCVEFCPLSMLVMSTQFNSKGYHYPEAADATKCSGCDLCSMYCPDFAICGTRVSWTGPTKE